MVMTAQNVNHCTYINQEPLSGVVEAKNSKWEMSMAYLHLQTNKKSTEIQVCNYSISMKIE